MKRELILLRFWCWYVKPSTKLIPFARKLFWQGINGQLDPVTMKPRGSR